MSLNPGPCPTMVAVCVCTCRRPEGLARLLERLALAGLGTLAPGHDVRLVVVDNAPDGRAELLCAQHRPRLGVPLTFAVEPVRGISMARNRAVATALDLGADLLAFIDDDDLPEPDWLVRLLERQCQTGAELVFGLASAPLDLAVPSWLHGLNDFRPRSLDPLNRYGLPAAAGSCNVLLHRRLVEALSVDGVLFLPELALTGGSDSELFVRARRQGFRTATAPLSRVVTGADSGRQTLRGVLRRHYRYGTSQVAVASRHLDAAELRRMRAGARRKLAKAAWRIPLALASPPVLVARLAEFARSLGKLASFRGRRYRYYGDGTG
ncbi:MAG TPA: glycosyltransferase [Thermoanaerobaculia bacterium]|nr:glycosyltransferase [Thermoanaerobaculia bacterium]